MYLLNSEFLKSPKLTIDHLEVGKLKKNFDLGPRDHQMMQQQILIMFCLIK
jgi:hypothetical protein